MKLNLPHFLFINGPAGAGKSTLSRMICESHSEAYPEGFAEPIRAAFWATFFPEAIVDKPFNLKDQTIKNTPIATLAKLYNGDTETAPTCTVREWMISFSERHMKPCFGQDIFGRLLWNRCCEQTQFYSSFIIDDSGFRPEAEAIVSRIGSDSCCLIRLARRGCNYSGDSRGYIGLERVRTYDLHNDGAPDEMMHSLQLFFGNI